MDPSPAWLPDDAALLAVRWVHVVVGVAFVGLTWFAAWVVGPGLAALDERSREAAAAALAPRTLFATRWSVALAWLSGTWLLMAHYYTGPFATTGGARPSTGTWLAALGGLGLGFAVYDVLARLLGRHRLLALAVLAGLACAYGGWTRSLLGFSARGTALHVGALLGTIAAGNVWLRIAPTELRRLRARAGTGGPSGEALEGSEERRGHNAALAVPLLLLMLAVHLDGLLAAEPTIAWIAAVLVAGLAAGEGLGRALRGVRRP